MSADSKPEVVVVTGASGGVGRAVAHAFAKRGAQIGLLARGEPGLEGARREVESLGGAALVLPTDVADHAQVEAAAEAVEQRFGPIDVWVNDAMATVFAPFLKVEPEEFKRATEVTYLGTVYGTMAALTRMVAAQPRHRRPGRLGARLPRDPAAIGLLRREVRDPRLHRLGADRADARPQPRLDHDGAAARRQHAAVQLVPHEAAGPPAAGAADLPARGPRRGGLLGRAPSPARARRRRQRASRRSSGTSSRRASPTGTWRAPATHRSRSRTCR